MTLRNYESGPILESYVEAQSMNDAAIVWRLDMYWGDHWTVRYSVRTVDSQGEDVLEEFEDREAIRVDDAIHALDAAITDLVGARNAVERFMR